jgi:chromosome partitioning protein
MTAKVICAVNQKGGVGKSTLTMQLAGTLARSHAVLVVDGDPQGTVTKWAATAKTTPFPAAMAGLANAREMLHREVEKHLEGHDLILIDCPPAIDSVIPQSALLISDLALVPIVPSPPDLWAGVAVKHLIELSQKQNPDLDARLVINMLLPRTRLSQSVLEILPNYGIPMLETKLQLLTAYRESSAYGSTVHEMGRRGATAAAEMQALANEVTDLLGL